MTFHIRGLKLKGSKEPLRPVGKGTTGQNKIRFDFISTNYNAKLIGYYFFINTILNTHMIVNGKCELV